MRKQNWTKRDPIKNYFPLPNEIYDLGLSRGAISVYSFLLRREDRKTYQCLLSYREIGEGVGMCVTTVRKYVAELEERSLIRTERTTVTTKDGRKRNGRLLYHKIDRGLGNEVAEDSSEAAQNPLADFHPVMRRTRKPGTGCITQINNHLFEGRYSPTWPDGTKHSKCVYAHTREECEEKLKVLIQQLNAERKAILDRLRGIPSPEKLTKKQRQIWEYMRLCPDETNYSTIAKGAKVTRHTVAKHFEMIQKMLV